MTDYEKLRAELEGMGETLAKAQAVEQADDDKKIAQAADAADPNDPKGGQTDDNAAAKPDAENFETFAKSFAVTLEDGTSVEAFDGTEMVKALFSMVKAQGAELHTLRARVEQADQLLTAMPSVLKSLTDASGKHGEMLKALREAPGGRQSVLKSPEQPPQKQDAETLLAKSMDALTAGRITGAEVAQIENRVRTGLAVPPDLLSRVNAA